jgi:Ni/Fe-hydrogenase subunit HybB-like protein
MSDHEYTDTYTPETRDFRSWFMDKLLMGMTWSEYARSLITPFNIVVAIILSVGLPLIALRFVHGLAFATHASNEYPWGLYLGWGLFGGVPLSATGFVMGTAYYIFGFKRYRPLVRLGLLAGFLGYMFAVIFLLTDLGRPWRIYYPMAVSFGTASILFLVAWHVSTYLTVQLIEISPALLEWIKSQRVRRWILSTTIGMTIAGIILSTLHQSALGGMFLLAPGKVHPLWYSSYIPVLFLSSSIYAALAMVIALSTLCSRFLRDKCDDHFLGSLDGLTIGLGKGAAMGMYAYFAVKVVALAHDHHWGLLLTPYGKLYLLEVIGFVLVPAVIFTLGYKNNSTFAVRFAGFYAVIGVLFNRINISILAFNWNLPGHLHHIVPPWKEAVIVLTISTIHILVFRWIVNRMPILRDEPGYDVH